MSKVHPSMQGVGDDASDVQRMQIVQPMSKDGDDHAGTFLCSTGMAYESMRVVLLATRDMRQYWDKGNFKHPMCKSHDMVAPSEKFFEAMKEQGVSLSAISSECDTCEMAQWTKDDKDKQQPPECRETHCYTMLDVETGMPFYLDLKGISIKPSKSIRTALKYRGAIWCLEMTMGLEKQGRNYKVIFSDHKPTSPEDMERYEALSEQLSGRGADDVDDDDTPF